VIASRVSRRSVALIALAPTLLLVAFAWVAGWIGPTHLSGAGVADALEHNAGQHRGYRRAHAKGLCFRGHFDGDGTGVRLSQAGIFLKGSHPVIGRFSTGGGNPFASDGRPVFHAMALQLTAPDGQIWRMAMDHVPIFPVATPEAFVELQRASKPIAATGKPDPTAMKTYLAKHPETVTYQRYFDTAPLPGSFASGTYYSINAFRFIDAAGVKQTVRWSFVPETATDALDKSRLANLPDDFLFDELLVRLAKGPVRWRMTVTVAKPTDVSNNATVAWPADRPTIQMGILTIDRAEPEETGACRDITFDPTILPTGVAISDDPLLPARAASYSASFRRRAEEGPEPSAVGKTFAALRRD
jgi:catalase